jgi:MFS family permease
MLRRIPLLAELQALFRSSPAFKRVFIADVVTQLGDSSLLLAFPMLILARTHDMTLTGVSFAGEFLAFGLLSPFAGYWADRLEQKGLMIAADVVRIALLALMLLALALELPIGFFIGLSVLLGGSSAFFMPARSAFLRRLLDGDELERAIALEGTISFLLRLVGPPLTGLLLAVAAPTVALQGAMLAYAAGVLLLWPAWVTGRELEPVEGEGDDWREGWRFLMREHQLRGLLGLDVIHGVIGTAAFSLTIALLDQALRLPPQANGWLLATTGLTGAVGTTLAARLGSGRPVFALLTAAVATTYMLVPLAASLPALMAMWMLRGLAIGAYCVLINQRMAALTPATIMGRVQSAWGLAACMAAFLGSVSTPLLLRTLGAVQAYTLFGMVLTLVTLAYTAPLVLRWRRLEAV